MITSFVQVGLEGFQRLLGADHKLVVLTPTSIAVMLATVAIKGGCWFWCRLVRNSAVQALAADAYTDGEDAFLQVSTCITNKSQSSSTLSLFCSH